jgi:hypothetical protein
MSQKQNVLSIKRVKRGNQLVFKTQGDLAIYNAFVKSLEDGQVVEEYLEANVDTGTNLQLAKIHACIRELSLETGYTFSDMKIEVKKHCGLCWRAQDGEYCKSFADCSVAELALAIESIIQIGDTVGINFRGQFPDRV